MENSIPSLSSVWHRRGWVALLVFISTLCGSLAYVLLTSPVYEVQARLILNDRELGISELSRDISQISSYSTGESSALATQIELIKSERVIKEAIARTLPETADPVLEKMTGKHLRNHLKIKIIPDTNIIELTYENEDEQLAVNLLNRLSEVLVEESGQDIRLEAKAVREFLEQEVPRQRGLTEAAEAAENAYRQTSGLVNVQEQTTQLVESLADLEAQERTLVADYQEKATQAEQLQQLTGINNPKKAYIGSRVGADKEIDEIRVRLAGLESQLAAARARFTDENPIVRSLATERDLLVQLYEQKLSQVVSAGESLTGQDISSDELSKDLITALILAQSESAALADKVRALRAERQKLLIRLDRLPEQQQPLAALVRQREEAEETLKFLQGKLEEARLAEAQLLGNLRIISVAQRGSGENQKPSKKVVLALAIAFGLILAVGLVVLLEAIDNTLHDDGEIENLLKLPLLGVLPNLPQPILNLNPPEAFLDNGRFVESYRLLLKTLEFRSPDPLKLVVISSAIASEGKSTVVAHLAAVSALLGRRTLIIDADLRCPQQHGFWNVEAQQGLTESLTSKIPWRKWVKSTGIEHLDILTSGELTARPSKLLESSAMQLLLREAAQSYDLAIVDTAPVSSCGDAHTLSHYGNGLVLVTRPNVTPKDTLIRAVSDLKSNGVSIIGVAVNGMTAYTTAYYRSPLQGKLSQIKALQPAKKIAKTEGGDRDQ